MLLTGIVLGLVAGFTQSVSYIFSRQFVLRHHTGPFQLLVFSHLIMGVISIAILPFLWTGDVPNLLTFVWPVVGVTVFYLFGQLCFFISLRNSDASRLSPLLAFKIVFLALVTATFWGEKLVFIQWLGIVLCVASAFLLNYSGEKLPWKSFVFVIIACLGFATSDLNIKLLVDRLDCLGAMHSILLSVCCSYVLCGFAASLFLPWVRSDFSVKSLVHATPFAITWLLAMVFLFSSFALAGVVFGNILQSTRGIFSVIIGGILAKSGYEHIEQKTSKSVFARRLAAAVMMCLAILLYVLPKF